MTSQEILLAALKTHGIEVISVKGNHVIVQNNYEIEVEANGVYKLLNEVYIVGPFDNINSLCRFILT